MRKIAITGAAGYIGSALSLHHLRLGDHVLAIDKLIYGGESLLGCLEDDKFKLIPTDLIVSDPSFLMGVLEGYDVLYHLAAIVGFPACQQVGESMAFKYNTELAEKMHRVATEAGVKRFIFASTYSNYGVSDGSPLTEESPLHPQSIYAKTKVAAERVLLDNNADIITIIPRFATLFGLSPRPRLDLIINQFVMEAITKREIILYQKDFRRSFVHIRDVIKALVSMVDAPANVVDKQIFNVGGESGNLSKMQIIDLIKRAIPDLKVRIKDISFGSDMRDVILCFDKIKNKLDFVPSTSVSEGITELTMVYTTGILKDLDNERYRNARFIVS